MASRKIEADVVVKVTGAEDVEAVAEQVRELADSTTNVEVEVDGEEQVKQLREEFKDLDNVTVTATAKVANQNSIDAFIKNVRGLDGETATAVLAVRSAQAEAAVRDLVVTIADINSTEAEVKVAMGQLPQAKADLDQLRTAIVDINATPVEVQTGGAEEGFRKVGDSAGQAGNVIANTVGNATQDMLSLGGVAGTTGQAVGQMAEMFTEAASGSGGLAAGLSTVVAAAGPILGIAAVLGIVTSVLGEQAAAAEASAQRTKEFADAMAQSSNDALGFVDVLRQNEDGLRDFAASANSNLGDFGIALERTFKKIPLLGSLVDETSTDVVAAMGKAGLSVYDLGTALDDNIGGMAGFIAKLQDAKNAGQITGEEFRALKEAATEMNAEVQKAAETQGLYNVNQEEANALLQASRDPLTQYTEQWSTLTADMADGTIGTEAAAQALNFLSDKLGLTRDQILDLAQGQLDETMEASADAAADLAEGMDAVNDAFSGTEERVAALGRAFDQFNAGSDLNFSEMAVNTVESFDSIKEAMSEVADIGSRPLVPTTVEDLRGLSDESAKVVGAIGGMRDAIQTELGAALTEAGGNFDAVRDKAAFFRDEVTSQFTAAFTEMGLGPAEVESKVTELLGSLGLLPSQVETQITMTGEEEAQRKLELFGSAIDSLPPEVKAQVIAAVDANDPIAAWNLISSTLQAQGAATVPTAADPTGAQKDVQGFANATQPTATVPVDANPKQATTDVGGFVKTTEAQKPVVNVGASVAGALITMAIINAIAQAMAPTVRIDSDISAVLADLRTISNQRPRVPVEAYLADYPTASEIAARIGRPRIPVDIVVGQSIRITGVRE